MSASAAASFLRTAFGAAPSHHKEVVVSRPRLEISAADGPDDVELDELLSNLLRLDRVVQALHVGDEKFRNVRSWRGPVSNRI